MCGHLYTAIMCCTLRCPRNTRLRQHNPAPKPQPCSIPLLCSLQPSSAESCSLPPLPLPAPLSSPSLFPPALFHSPPALTSVSLIHIRDQIRDQVSTREQPEPLLSSWPAISKPTTCSRSRHRTHFRLPSPSLPVVYSRTSAAPTPSPFWQTACPSGSSRAEHAAE